MYEDKTLNLFVRNAVKGSFLQQVEQEFYAEKGFVNEPQRCKACRDARKNILLKAIDRCTQQLVHAVAARHGICSR